MWSLAALALWGLALPCFLGGQVWIGLALGALAYGATRAAAERADDAGTLYGLMLQAMLLVGLIRLLGVGAP